MTIDPMIRQILDFTDNGELAKYVSQHAARAFAIEQAIIQSRIGGIGIVGGMGLEEQTIILPPPYSNEATLYHIRMTDARKYRFKSWRGLNVQGTSHHVDLFAALEKAPLNQESFDFITLADVKHSTLDSILAQEDMSILLGYAQEEVDLLYAFQKQMLNEAQDHPPLVGAFVMSREPLKAVDSEIVYDNLRVVVSTEGLIVSIVKDQMYAPFYWTPEGYNTSQVWFHPRAVFVLDALMACIWRDLCCVKERWSTKTGRSMKLKPSREPKPTKSKIYLPRTIHHVLWSNPEERRYTDRSISGAWAVRGFYRVLPEGREARKAYERAEQYGFPAPPPGYTFVKPHIRGEGMEHIDNFPKPQIVCNGLNVARLVLGG